jgi:hypothetical protein
MNNKFIYSVFCFFMMNANMGPQGFCDFENHYFVETGTFSGDGIRKALKCNFKEIISLELDFNLFKAVKPHFDHLPNIKIHLADSSKDLWNIIKPLDKKITFWLDAHSCPPREDGGKNCPLIEELEQIGRHHIKNHTILIDDMHCAETILFDYLSKEDLKKAIWKINPNYKIFYVPGGDEGEYPQNVMVAIIE